VCDVHSSAPKFFLDGRGRAKAEAFDHTFTLGVTSDPDDCVKSTTPTKEFALSDFRIAGVKCESQGTQ
jgi:hypothetical protein